MVIKLIALPFAKLYNGLPQYLFSTKMWAFSVTYHDGRLVNLRTWPLMSDQCPCKADGLESVSTVCPRFIFYSPRDGQRTSREACTNEAQHTVTTDWVYQTVKHLICKFALKFCKFKKDRIRYFCVTFLTLVWLVDFGKAFGYLSSWVGHKHILLLSTRLNVFENLHSGTKPGLLEVQESHQQGHCSKPATVWQPPYTGLPVTKYFVPQSNHSRVQPVYPTANNHWWTHFTSLLTLICRNKTWLCHNLRH